MKDTVEVRDKEIARVLTDITQVKLLKPFFEKDTTLSDAAQKLEVKLTTLLYHVSKFLKLGLLEVSKEEARKGKPIKYYRTTAKAFFVPFDITPNLSLKHLLNRLSQPDDDVFHREIARMLQDVSLEWGIEVFSNQPASDSLSIALRRKDKPREQDVSFRPEEPALISSLGRLNLDFKTAKALQHDMRELLESYSKKQNPKEQLYFYRIGLTPVQDESFEPKD
jgi:hypothetical protein